MPGSRFANSALSNGYMLAFHFFLKERLLRSVLKYARDEADIAQGVLTYMKSV